MLDEVVLKSRLPVIITFHFPCLPDEHLLRSADENVCIWVEKEKYLEIMRYGADEKAQFTRERETARQEVADAKNAPFRQLSTVEIRWNRLC